jgi:large subunit ribosomal protein L23
MNILVKPIITEKSLGAASTGKYTFEVIRVASKNQIKAAIESQFSVEVIAVNTQILKGTSRRTGKRRLPSTTATTKKAIVELKKGQTIALFESKE